MRLLTPLLSLSISAISLVFLISSFTVPHSVYAQEETGLCPDGFREGIVTTGYVDCFRESRSDSDLEEVELLQLEREAVCLATPNSELISSEITVDNNGRYTARLICRINRNVSPETVICPEPSLEVYRAFSNLICRFPGSAALTETDARAAQAEDEASCLAASPMGTIVDSSVRIFLSASDEPFYTSNVACGFTIPATDIFACPVGFEEDRRSEDLLECTRRDLGLPTMDEANLVNSNVRSICENNTAGLGVVENSEVQLNTTTGLDDFFSIVECHISLPRYSDFQDGEIIRACDESCTEDIEQTRRCLNGGTVGGPGCSESDAQIVTQKCNTGTVLTSACPLLGVPSANIVPLLLLDDEEEADE